LDSRSILILLFGCVNVLFAHPSAEKIFNQSTQLLSFHSIKFQVQSQLSSGDFQEEQYFSFANKNNVKQSVSLICYLSPDNIRGSAILFKRNKKNYITLIYLPSLGRSRILPKENENDEALGIGLSFAEIQNKSNIVKYLGEDQKYYKIEKIINKNERIDYKISKKDMIVRKMQFFKGNKLQKEIFIKEITIISKKPIITKWVIKDYKNNKQTLYKVDKQTIKTSFSSRIFNKSMLSHCRP